MFTMGDVARCSHENEDLLYRLFGKNAELLIDHAWGWEPCTVEAVKAYRPSENSVGSGQVLHCPYTFDKARLVLREMAESLTLDLVSKGLVTNQVIVTVGYDVEISPTRSGDDTTQDRLSVITMEGKYLSMRMVQSGSKSTPHLQKRLWGLLQDYLIGS